MTYTDSDPGRVAGARYEVDLPDGSWWELGWDPPLATFYAQLYAAAPGDEPPAAWHGTRPAQHPDVDSLEEALGWVVPAEIRSELEADRVALGGGT
ncbi:MAG: hypothetical protein ACLGIO_03170 [Acidimicrobiia bacterium]